MDTALHYDVIVVGSGISGMATAFRLQQQGLSVKVLEKSAVAGGRIDTVRKDGFTFETGPTALPNTYHELIALLNDVGMGDKLIPIEGPLGIIKNGEVKHLRFSSMAADMLRSRLLSWKSLFSLRHLAFLLLKNKNALNYTNLGKAAHLDNQTIGEFCGNRVSREAYEFLVDLIVRSSYMHSAKDASLVELLWVLNNLISDTVYFIGGGTSEITRHLQQHLDIEFNAPVTEVAECPSGVDVTVLNSHSKPRALRAKYCVMATEPAGLLSLLPHWLSPAQRDFLTSYDYGHFIYVGLALNGTTKEKAYLMQVPSSTNPNLTGIALDHNRSPNYPANNVITAYFLNDWSERMADESDETIRDAAIEALAPIIPEVKTRLASYYVKHTVPGVTMSKGGDYRKMAAFYEDIRTNSRIQIVGDFFSMSSMNTCAARAEVATDNICRKLGTSINRTK